MNSELMMYDTILKLKLNLLVFRRMMSEQSSLYELLLLWFNIVNRSQ